MKVLKFEFFHLDIPFTEHGNRYLQFWLPHWQISQVCKLTLENGIIGWGETIPNYTWSPVPENIQDRILKRPAAELLWDDTLGAGVQMALFDAVAKSQKVPIYRLLGNKVREWCPISWWQMDMPPRGWAQECKQAVKAGYLSAKLKARPWFDLHAGIQAVRKVVPEGFHLDLDYNATLGNSANAIPHLKELETYKEVAMIESPIPQEDVDGNRQIRTRINRPIAMHYGNPPILTTLQVDITDGFVISAGASNILRQAAVCDEANKPFWLQLVGTGITTAWAAHLGAVLPQAKWPAITCMNIWKNQLIKPKHEIRGGFYRVPEEPGLGIQIDQTALKRFKCNHTTLDTIRHIYQYSRANGEITLYANSKQDLHQIYPKDAQPISEKGSIMEVIQDDGSKDFDRLYHTAMEAPIKKIKKK